jgi:hypothetical protein
MADNDENLTECRETPDPDEVGIGHAVVALILPLLAGGVLLFVTSLGLALVISGSTVLVSSILLGLDARHLGNIDPSGRRRMSADFLFVMMLLLWLVFYPLAFFRRRHFGGPNLAIPAILVALFFGFGPALRWMLIPPGLPSCTSQEVVQLLEQLIHGMPVGATVKSIDGHRDVGYDREANCRQGQCVMHTNGADIVVNYRVEWRDRDKRQFQVRILPAELPSCTSQEVVRSLEQLIRGTPAGAKAISINGHRELRYDPEAHRRQGQCVVHTDDVDIVVNYLVEWHDRDKGLITVRLTQ